MVVWLNDRLICSLLNSFFVIIVLVSLDLENLSRLFLQGVLIQNRISPGNADRHHYLFSGIFLIFKGVKNEKDCKLFGDPILFRSGNYAGSCGWV